MKKYHIAYYENEEDVYSKGEVIDANDELEALTKFRLLRPNAIFASLISSELIEQKAVARG